MLVIAEDLVVRTLVLGWQGRVAIADIEQLLGKSGRA